MTSPHFENAELRCHGATCGPNKTGCMVNGVQQSALDMLEEFPRRGLA
jgi:hypothetical protein